MAMEPEMLHPPIEVPAGSTLPRGLVLRRPRVADRPAVVASIPDWWGMPGTSIHLLLPPLFFQHFSDTSLIAEDDGGLGAFLIGFHSHAQPGVAYIHFVGIRPDLRGLGLARTLYETFFAEARAAGCHRVDAITGVPNRGSQAFHAALGFEASGDTVFDGVRAWRDYDGPGEHRIAFSRAI